MPKLINFRFPEGWYFLFWIVTILTEKNVNQPRYNPRFILPKRGKELRKTGVFVFTVSDAGHCYANQSLFRVFTTKKCSARHCKNNPGFEVWPLNSLKVLVAVLAIEAERMEEIFSDHVSNRQYSIFFSKFLLELIFFITLIWLKKLTFASQYVYLSCTDETHKNWLEFVIFAWDQLKVVYLFHLLHLKGLLSTLSKYLPNKENLYLI